MSLQQITQIRRPSTRPSRPDRSQATIQPPPPVACLLSFVFACACPIGAFFLTAVPLVPIQQYAILAATGIATLWCLIRMATRRRPGQPVKKVRSYAISGLIAGCLIAGVGFTSGVLPLNSGSEPRTDQPGGPPDSNEVASDDDGASEVSPVAEGDELPEGSNVEISLGASHAEEEPDQQGAVSEAKPDELKPLSPSLIPKAAPTVLPSGTRLQVVSSKQNKLTIRLEEKDGVFIPGLSKDDFALVTPNGNELQFEMFIVPEDVIAVRSNVSMVVDEGLSLQEQQYAATHVIETVLNDAARAGYRLSTAGNVLRTLTDWTSNPDDIRSATSRFRNSWGNALSVSVSLNVTELSRMPSPRILLLVPNGNQRSVQAPFSASLRGRLAQANIATLVVAPKSELKTPFHRTGDNIQFFTFEQLDEFQLAVRKLTTRREPPSYLIQNIEPHRGVIRLRVGSGDSAVSVSIPDSLVTVSP